jgi:hypothetical protein
MDLFSSISEHAMEYHDQITHWLEAHPTVKMAFQPGTFQIDAGVHRLRKLYGLTEVLALNREEAVEVSGGDHGNLHDLFDKLHALGPKIVLITDGHAGAYASDGSNRFKMPIYPDPKPPYDRTGALSRKWGLRRGCLARKSLTIICVKLQLGTIPKGCTNEQKFSGTTR